MSHRDFLADLFKAPPVEPAREMAAYEALWLGDGATVKTVAQTFERHPGALPSELVPDALVDQTRADLDAHLEKSGLHDFGISVHGTADYPPRLRDAAYPVELLYYKGTWDYVFSKKSVAIVGSRKPSSDGESRANRLARMLVREDFTIYSGLADGIDKVAHWAAIDAGGRTVAVLGTPLSQVYPKTNADLQAHIARDHLLVSQVPFLRYAQQTFNWNRLFFPERNVTMSALADATIIVEAGETSGTLIQARAALKQGRKLFILDSCFQNPYLTWPHRFEQQGAKRIRHFEEILEGLADGAAKED